mgnify:CR=1 FL=1
MDNTDTNETIDAVEPVIEFKFNKSQVIPAIKRSSKKLIAGAAIFAVSAALTFAAVRSVPVIDDAPEELEHDDLDDVDDSVESEDPED